MKKHTLTLIILWLSIPLLGQNDTTLTFNQTKVKLSVEKQRWFTKIEGSGEGPELIQKFGKLSDVIKTIDDTANLKVKSRLESKLWKIDARGPEAKHLSPYLREILTAFSKLEPFDWTVEMIESDIYHAFLNDKKKLTEHLNKEYSLK